LANGDALSRKETIGVKLTSNALILLTVALVFSVFMGVAAGAMGLGSWFPQLNRVAQPFVWPNGQMSYAQNVTQIDADTYWSATWVCVDQESGATTPLDRNTVFLFAGPFYGLLLFVVLVIWYRWGSRQPQQDAGQSAQVVGSAASDRRARKAAAAKARAAAEAQARMKSLKDMRAGNMITETEYQQKRVDILKDM
jgi:hypothetical protein